MIGVSVQDCEALSLAVRGDRKMIAWLDLAARGEAEVVASPTFLGEAYDGRTPEAPCPVSCDDAAGHRPPAVVAVPSFRRKLKGQTSRRFTD
ncbi:hypothetical protein [Streptomyces sp. NBC_01530]|uniref:hypothetical protein n=1 Tax=Streptomyces sp. NBC_01530 TaxID=2903895 RepID=UPI00386E4E42